MGTKTRSGNQMAMKKEIKQAIKHQREAIDQSVRKTQFYNSKELAHKYGLSENTPAQWRVAGVGPKFLKFGKIVLYPIVEVETWERENIIGSTAEK